MIMDFADHEGPRRLAAARRVADGELQAEIQDWLEEVT
jgi:hypothetical protein